MTDDKNLDSYNFSTKVGFNAVLLKLRYQELSQYFVGRSCLEFGCSDGEGTKILLGHFKTIVAVDGSLQAIRNAEKEIGGAEFIHSTFENFSDLRMFDTILLTHILEHVENPNIVLSVAKKFLAPKGRIIVDVPNAHSLHRQMGVLMGMIPSENSLNEADLSIGHRRVYRRKELHAEVESAGFSIIESGGMFLKCFSNAQLEKLSLHPQGLSALNELGKKYPDTAAELYIVGELKR